ncbi:hypothetical protein E4T43_06049 [Aureobasidium subglaciale]|nr:hypothetical protein E4T43_06049 [Aureobasidium subglaciale]
MGFAIDDTKEGWCLCGLWRGSLFRACIAASIRLSTNITFSHKADRMYFIGPLLFWACAEMTCGFFILSVPCIPSVVKHSGLPGLIDILQQQVKQPSQRSLPYLWSSLKMNIQGHTQIRRSLSQHRRGTWHHVTRNSRKSRIADKHAGGTWTARQWGEAHDFHYSQFHPCFWSQSE